MHDYEDALREVLNRVYRNTDDCEMRISKDCYKLIIEALEKQLGVDTTTDIEVDHIDGDRLNNTRSNLRLCTRRENAFNKGVYKNNSSGVSGVYYQKKPQKWSSYINVDKHMINIGTFNNFEDAVAARLAAEKLYFGEFSRSNNQYAEKIS